ANFCNLRAPACASLPRAIPSTVRLHRWPFPISRGAIPPLRAPAFALRERQQPDVQKPSVDLVNISTRPQPGAAVPHAAKTWATNRRGETLIAFVPKVLASADIRCWGHGPPVGREQHRLDVFRSNYAKRRTGEAGMPLQSFKCYLI